MWSELSKDGSAKSKGTAKLQSACAILGRTHAMTCREPATGFLAFVKQMKRRVLSYRGQYKRLYGLLSLPLIRHARMVFLRRIQPLPSRAGAYRGIQIPRYFFDHWISSQADSVRGHVAEIGDAGYVTRLGGSRVAKIDIVDIDPQNPQATIVADLSQADLIPDNSFDCLVVPFTFHIIYDFKSALRHSIRILKPGGVLLANFAGFGYTPAEAPLDYSRWNRYWYFTPAGVKRVLEELVPSDNIEMAVFGNAFCLLAHCMGLSVAELTGREVNFQDKNFPLLTCAKVVKPENLRARCKGFKSKRAKGRS
jgi:SAM-dependent methyltransferase